MNLEQFQVETPKQHVNLKFWKCKNAKIKRIENGIACGYRIKEVSKISPACFDQQLRNKFKQLIKNVFKELLQY